LIFHEVEESGPLAKSQRRKTDRKNAFLSEWLYFALKKVAH
jgi:uncharacterized protein YqiB (DUF1249 family)